MASINGLELKNVKSFIGHEGKCYQGNLYLNGKKIGMWSQDGWGGPDEYWFENGLHINEGKFNTLVRESFPPVSYYGHELPMDLDILMGEILTLKDREKGFNKHKDSKYPVLVVIENMDMSEEWNFVPKDRTDEEIEATKREQIHIYRRLEDFIIGEPFKLEDITEG